MRKFILSAALVLSAAVAGTTPAFAAVSWCDSDPLVTVTTPAGHQVSFHVNLQAEGAHLSELQAAEVHAVALPGPNQGSEIVIWTEIPEYGNDGHFRTREQVVDASGAVVAKAAGQSDRPLIVHFHIATS